ncbi:MAG TPA: FkbM family methyltransferase [Terracidiphilus sp.]|nr:FkbM family methyltransferase [Terracidiphilus sp.]
MKESPFAEAVLNSLVQTCPNGLIGKLKYRSLSKARAMLAHNEKRLVRYRLDGTELLLPLSHELPLFRRSHPQYSCNIGRITSSVLQKYPSATIIDIGANVGDTAAIIRANSKAPILCIEGDAYFFRLLQINVARSGMRDIEACFAFVGAEQCEIRGGLRHASGTASYSSSAAQSTNQIPLSDILEKFPNFRQSKLLKIDTDGFDCQIVAAELKWISEARPVTFIEYDPYLTRAQGYSSSNIFSEMASVGYELAVFWENTGEYMLTAKLADHTLIEDIHLRYSRSLGRSYVDIAFIHEEDRELAWKIREAEKAISIDQVSA